MEDTSVALLAVVSGLFLMLGLALGFLMGDGYASRYEVDATPKVFEIQQTNPQRIPLYHEETEIWSI